MPIRDPWLLKQDGVELDRVAVNVATKGLRGVRLTPRERKLAALIIRRDYRQLCDDYGQEYDAEVFTDLIYEHLWMPGPDLPACRRPPRSTAAAYARALPDGAVARRFVLLWTDSRYRQRENKRNREAMRASRLAA